MHRYDPPTQLGHFLPIRQTSPLSRWSHYVQRTRRCPFTFLPHLIIIIVIYCCFTSTASIDRFLSDLGYPTPPHANPSDHAISLINTEFYDAAHHQHRSSSEHLAGIAAAWVDVEAKYNDDDADADAEDGGGVDGEVGARVGSGMTMGVAAGMADGWRKTGILTRRNFLNYTRNPVAFGIRSTSSPSHGFYPLI
jgi:hypothetical protein